MIKNTHGFSRKLDLVELETCDGQRKWLNCREVSYYSEYTGDTYTIPAGFVTNLASIPRMFWWMMPPDGNYAWESALHDYLYSSLCPDISQGDADRVYREALYKGKVSKTFSYILYKAVRFFGEKYYIEAKNTPPDCNLMYEGLDD